MPDAKTFADRDVTVTLTGREWVVILARMVGHTNPRYALSTEGAAVYHAAAVKLADQLAKEGKI